MSYKHYIKKEASGSILFFIKIAVRAHSAIPLINKLSTGS